MSKRVYDDDDGRTIADMNVEGMPWYQERRRDEGGNEISPLSKDESRVAMWGALKAALLVVGVISVGLILFTLFCTEIWLR